MRKIKILIGILLFIVGTNSCDKIQAQNQFYCVDTDIQISNDLKIKKGYLVQKINDTTFIYGFDTVKVNNFQNFTQTEFFSPDFKSKILFVKNEIDSSLYMYNNTEKTLLTKDLQDSIKTGYFKLNNVDSDIFSLFYNDSVTLVKSNGNKTKALVTIPLFFKIEKLQLVTTLKKGNDSLCTKNNEKFIYINNNVDFELNFCYTDSLLSKIISDSSFLYFKSGNEYLIFNADNIYPIPNNPIIDWLSTGLNWLWIVIGFIIIIGVFVLVMILKNNENDNRQGVRNILKNLFNRMQKTKESSNTEKVKFLRVVEKSKAIFQLTIKEDNKIKLLKELSIKQEDIQQTDNIIEVSIALKEEQCRKSKDLQNLENWIRNRCSIDLFYKINDLSDYNALKQGTKYLIPKPGKLTILYKYAEYPIQKQESEKQEKSVDIFSSNEINLGDEKEPEIQSQPIEDNEEKIFEDPNIEIPQVEEPQLLSLSDKFHTIIKELTILDNEDESKIKEIFNNIKSSLLSFQTDIVNTETKNYSAINSYSQQFKAFKNDKDKQYEEFKKTNEIEKKKAINEVEERIKAENDGKISEKEDKLQGRINAKENEIKNIKESYEKALLEKEEEYKKKIEKIKDEKKADLVKMDVKIKKIKNERDEIKENTEKEWKVKLVEKENALDDELKKHKADIERLTNEKTDAITEEKKASEKAVKAEQEKAKRYHENVIFADELKPYAEKVLSLIEMGHKLQTECNKFYTKEKNNTNAAFFMNKAFAKFSTSTYNLKIGDWREQLNNIVYNGTIIVPPAGKENNHSSVYATIRQAIKENLSKEQRIEAFQKDIAIALLNRFCGALLVMVEDMKVLAENKITIPKEIDELRKTLRLQITKELGLKIHDIALLEKLNNNNYIEVIDEIISSLTKDDEKVVEVLFYGVGRDRVDKTKVIISK